MWAYGRRTKKLIVAFHFLGSDQAGWKCDACRRQKLEVRRRCGFLSESERGANRVVWARNGASTDECPRTAITAESVAMIEVASAARLGLIDVGELTAREAEAIAVLQREG